MGFRSSIMHYEIQLPTFSPYLKWTCAILTFARCCLNHPRSRHASRLPSGTFPTLLRRQPSHLPRTTQPGACTLGFLLRVLLFINTNIAHNQHRTSYFEYRYISTRTIDSPTETTNAVEHRRQRWIPTGNSWSWSRPLTPRCH